MEKEKVKSGDKVEIVKSGEKIEGTLIESYESGLILLKLNSGYNIGIKKEDVVEIVLKEKNKKKEEKVEIKENTQLPKIDVIATGGTICSRVDSETGGVKWLTSPEDLFGFYPEIFDIVNVKNVKVPFMKASENMDYLDWKKIAEEVQNSLNDKEVKGVIVTHGTDFLHYTSSALTFFLKNLNKPVVLTYSQRSSDRGSSDARLNLQCSARAAISDVAEVMLVGHANENDNFCYALKGNKARKMHTSKRDAFKSINSEHLAKVWPDKIETILDYNKRNKEKVEIDTKFNDNVAILKFYPGMDPEILDFISRKYEGLVIELSGLGHLASEEARKNLLPALKKAIKNGLVVAATPQTIYGRLNPRVYSLGRKLNESGIIFLEDVSTETAFVKLGYVLGHKEWKNKIKEKMLENISGEFNKRLKN